MAEFKLFINEYGKEVRTYSDNDKQRFLEKAKDLIIEHITKSSHQSATEVKNVTFQIATIS